MINSISPKINFSNDQFQGASKLVGFDVDKYVFGKDLSSDKKPVINTQNNQPAQNNHVQNKKKANSAIGALLLTGLVAGTTALVLSLKGKTSFFSKMFSKTRMPKA